MFFMKRILPIMMALSAVTAAFAQERQPYFILEPVLESFHAVCIHSGCHAIIAQGDISQICLTVDHPDSLVMQSACRMEAGTLHLLPHPNVTAQRPARLYDNDMLLQVLVEPGATLLVTAQSVRPVQIILYTAADGSSGQLRFEGDSSRYPEFAKAVSYRSFPEKRQWKIQYLSLNLEAALSLFSNSHLYNNPYNIYDAYHLGVTFQVPFSATGSRFTWFTGLYWDNAFFSISQQVEVVTASNWLKKEDMVGYGGVNVYGQKMYAASLGIPAGFYYRIGRTYMLSVSVTPAYCLNNIVRRYYIQENSAIQSTSQRVDLINPWRLDLQVGFHSSQLHLPEVGLRANLLPTFRKGLTEKPVHEFSLYFKF